MVHQWASTTMVSLLQEMCKYWCLRARKKTAKKTKKLSILLWQKFLEANQHKTNQKLVQQENYFWILIPKVKPKFLFCNSQTPSTQSKQTRLFGRGSTVWMRTWERAHILDINTHTHTHGSLGCCSIWPAAQSWDECKHKHQVKTEAGD